MDHCDPYVLTEVYISAISLKAILYYCTCTFSCCIIDSHTSCCCITYVSVVSPVS